MTNKDNPAFPAKKQMHDSEGNYLFTDSYSGMSLREYFAGLAMQGFCSDGSTRTDIIPSLSVGIADALIAELNKEEE